MARYPTTRRPITQDPGDTAPGLLETVTPESVEALIREQSPYRSRRPEGLTDKERMALLVARVTEGQSVSKACPHTFGSRSTLAKALANDSSLRHDYEAALAVRADMLADEVLEIADSEPDAQKAKVRTECRRWWAGCMRPKVYGPKAEITVNSEINVLEILSSATRRSIADLPPIEEAEIVPPSDINDIFS